MYHINAHINFIFLKYILRNISICGMLMLIGLLHFNIVIPPNMATSLNMSDIRAHNSLTAAV